MPNPNTDKLVALRDQLVADFNLLIAASTADPNVVAQIVDAGNQFDAAVQAATVPVANALDFSRYDVSVNQLTENFQTIRNSQPSINLNQSVVDSLQVAMNALNNTFKAAMGIS